MAHAKLFVGLTLEKATTLSRLISSFRQRFDPKFDSNPDPHIALFAPFEIDLKDFDRLKEVLTDECESFFHGGAKEQISFTKLQTMSSKKDQILFLKPMFHTDLIYAADSLLDITKSYFRKDFKFKPNSSQLMPIGRFYDAESLESGIQYFSHQFKSQKSCDVDSLVLYMKKGKHWVAVESLYEFSDEQEHLLQEKLLCL